MISEGRPSRTAPLNLDLIPAVPGPGRGWSGPCFWNGDKHKQRVPDNAPLSYPDYRDLREQNHSFTGILAYNHDWITLTGGGPSQSGFTLQMYRRTTSACWASRPWLGRFFLPEEETRPDAVPCAPIRWFPYASCKPQFPACKRQTPTGLAHFSIQVLTKLWVPHPFHAFCGKGWETIKLDALRQHLQKAL